MGRQRGWGLLGTERRRWGRGRRWRWCHHYAQPLQLPTRTAAEFKSAVPGPASSRARHTGGRESAAWSSSRPDGGGDGGSCSSALCHIAPLSLAYGGGGIVRWGAPCHHISALHSPLTGAWLSDDHHRQQEGRGSPGRRWWPWQRQEASLLMQHPEGDPLCQPAPGAATAGAKEAVGRRHGEGGGSSCSFHTPDTPFLQSLIHKARCQ